MESYLWLYNFILSKGSFSYSDVRDLYSRQRSVGAYSIHLVFKAGCDGFWPGLLVCIKRVVAIAAKYYLPIINYFISSI